MKYITNIEIQRRIRGCQGGGQEKTRGVQPLVIQLYVTKQSQRRSDIFFQQHSVATKTR